MLLDENPSIELTDDDATNLTRLFSASVKKAVGEKIVPAADRRKQNHSKAQRVMELFFIVPFDMNMCFFMSHPYFLVCWTILMCTS